jgi:hypothetical protein
VERIHTTESKRSKADKKLAEAHSRVIARWHPEAVKGLHDSLQCDSLYRPLDPSDLEAQFIAEVKHEAKKVEVEPVVETFDGARVVVDWQPSPV